MGKREEIFIGTCIHIAKDDMIARGKPIVGNEDELIENAKQIFLKAKEKRFLDIPYM